MTSKWPSCMSNTICLLLWGLLWTMACPCSAETTTNWYSFKMISNSLICSSPQGLIGTRASSCRVCTNFFCNGQWESFTSFNCGSSSAIYGFSHYNGSCTAKFVIVHYSYHRSFGMKKSSVIICSKTMSFAFSIGETASGWWHSDVCDIELQCIIQIKVFVWIE